MDTAQPVHHAQILRSLPRWSRQLPAAVINALIEQTRPPYLDASGAPYDWYSQADEFSQQALARAVEKRQTSLRHLQRLLAPLKEITEFCAPLLERRLGIPVSVFEAQYRFQATEVEAPTGLPSGPNVVGGLLPVVPKGKPQLRSLLEAALHNFEGQHDTTRLSQLQCGADDAEPVPGLGVAAFIDHCRALDLGQRYQAHLSEVFDGPQAAEIRAAGIAARRDEMRVQVRVADLQGRISKPWFAALHGLCSDGPLPAPLRCWQVALFGVPIHELFLVRNADPARDPSVVIYWPQGPQPLREFPSLSAAFTHMRTGLADHDTLYRFLTLAPHALQPELLVRLRRALFENADDKDDQPLVRRNTVHLQASEQPLTQPLWKQLEEQHVHRLKGDARSIAVPTADVDKAVRLKQLAYWLDLGLTVLNVAAFCFPVLNPLMLAISAAQITDSVFEGVSAWEAGDNAQAMAQLESILLNVTLSAAVAGGGVALKASGFVDAMKSVKVEAQERLWQPSLRGYASETELGLLPPRNALGQYRIDGRPHVRIDGALYEQFEDSDGTWRVRHPRDSNAYAPALVHNGEGAWRLALENPLQWDFDTALARLQQVDDYLSLEDLRHAWLTTGLDAEVLQALHENAEPLPARVKEAIAQLKADQRVTQIIDHVRAGTPLRASDNFALPSLVQLPEWPQDHLIEAFEGPERTGVSTLFGRLPREPGDVILQISRTELEQGRLAEVVLAQMADPTQLDALPTQAHARSAALQVRLAEHLALQRQALRERIYHLSIPSLSAAGSRLAGQFPGLPVSAVQAIVSKASYRERQIMQAPTGRIPLRVLEEARVMLAQTRLDRALLGLYRPTLANADTARLVEGLHSQSPRLDGTALWRLATQERDRSAELIGQQPIRPRYRSPLALSHGRLGYPLSGRGVPRRTNVLALSQLEALYPGLSEEELMTMRETLARSGNLGMQIQALQNELLVLQRDLQEWARNSADPIQRDERLQWRERFIAGWRRLSNVPRTALTLENLLIGELPSISARLPHIRSLTLDALELQRLDRTFLECFPNLERLTISRNPTMDAASLFAALRAVPNLQALDLSGNGLTRLGVAAELALVRMRRLRELTLRRNRLTFDEADMRLLGRLPLDALNLQSNAITLTPVQASRFQDWIHPERLYLSFNPLGTPPDLRYMARLQTLTMANCDLASWPESLIGLMGQMQYRLRHIDLSMNRIHTLPDLDALLATPFVRDLTAGLAERSWHMNYNEMEPATRSRLLQAGAVVYEHVPLDEMPVWQMRWRAEATAEQDQLWNALVANDENQPLFGVLERLSGSAEAASHAASLRARVWNMLERASQDDALRQALNDEAQTFPPTCGDAGADAFSALEIRLLIQDASLAADPLREQLQVLNRVYRREQVNTLAQRIAWRRSVRREALVQAQYTGDESHLPPLDELDDVSAVPDRMLMDGLVDEIEIRLALRQILAPELDYPEPSVGMLYWQAAHINARIVLNVTTEVRRLDQDAVARRQWLVDQPQWQRTLREQNTAQFEALTDFWRQGLDYLDYGQDEQAEPVTHLPPSVRTLLEGVLGESLLDADGNLRRATFNEGQYLEAVRRIAQQREETERGLFDSLTKALEQRSS
ncbi:NEL-type E3 ubiquitin ligase domain-containing protein [Pseudomonas phoenicis]|uniref:NEL-type E3 ubiquitin ligase domain-containing protein n=1 Tax=unclassified Pseudomonas TaxID=196821 RepID=UPI0039A112EA